MPGREEDDGLRPDEVGGPEEAEADPERTTFEGADADNDSVDDSFFVAEDEVMESFPVEPIAIGVDPRDGLPVPVDEGSIEDAFAVPFTFETQLCVEDPRAFVEIFIGEFEAQGWSIHWDRDEDRPMPKWSRNGVRIFLLDLDMQKQFSTETGEAAERRMFGPDQVQERWGFPVALSAEGFVPVRSVRPVCRFYKRQVVDSKLAAMGQFGSQKVYRLCTARRSNGGAFMSLGDQGVFACDFRDPPDPRTMHEQDAKDLVKLRTRPDRHLVPAFGMPGDERRKDKS